MTVEELIAELQRLPEETRQFDVVIDHEDSKDRYEIDIAIAHGAVWLS